jgi:LDH2 family malate/lactate/ureidoglycolate dehydrogenase
MARPMRAAVKNILGHHGVAAVALRNASQMPAAGDFFLE